MLNKNYSPKTYIQFIYEKIVAFLRFIFFPRKNSSKFLRAYLLSIALGALLLYTPWALTSYQKTNGNPFTLIDALFTSTSAFTDTGLTVTTTASQFTIFGKTIIMLLIFTGGVGIIAIKMLFLKVIGKTIGLKNIILFKEERGSSKVGESIQVFYSAFRVMLWATLFGVITLAPYFFIKKQEMFLGTFNNVFTSIWYALFHSVSAINNAGFDIIGAKSFQIFSNDLWVQTIIIILIIMGGIGFPVLNDIGRYIQHKKQKRKTKLFKWSLFTKITVVTYFWIFIVGLILAFVFEIFTSDPTSLWNQAQTAPTITAQDSYTKFEVINSLIFTTFSTRNAGFSIIPIAEFQQPTRILWSTLMWIGSSPASTAGGIRTTTFAIAILATVSTWKRSNSTRVFAFNHRIPFKTMFQAFVVIFASISLLWLASMVIILDTQYTFPDLFGSSLYTFNNILFEAASAFGTTGLSVGITSMVGEISLWVIMILMIIGQMGITAWLSLLSRELRKSSIQDEPVYGEEDVLIS